MTVTIVDLNSVATDIGVAFRPRRYGPEHELVEDFLAQLPFSTPRGCHATIFREPRLASGFPDLVIVFWSVATALKWDQARSSLTPDDIRLAHYLYICGPLSEAQLRRVAPRGMKAALERLCAAFMIRRVGGIWQLRSLQSTFATRRIIAIEAKMSEWPVAVHQAFLNTWFASDSFVLVPQQAPSARIRQAAKRFGVRVCRAGDTLECDRSAFPDRVPRSYASWMFNEWSWRFLHSSTGVRA